MHLACIGVREVTEFEINDNQTSKAHLEEEQIHSIPSVSNAQAPLSPNESEVTAEFKKKCFKHNYERGLKIGLGVLVLHREELTQENISL